MKKLTLKKVKKWVVEHKKMATGAMIVAGLVVAGVMIRNSDWYRQKILHSRLQRNAKGAIDIPYLRGMRRGEWQGVLPCADCEGIETNIRLYTKKTGEAFGTYQYIQKYLGSEIGVLLSEGEWTMAIEEKASGGGGVNGEYMVFIPSDDSGEMYAIWQDEKIEMLNTEKEMLGEGYRLSEMTTTY